MATKKVAPKRKKRISDATARGKSKVKIVVTSTENHSQLEVIKSRQQDGIGIFSLLGANLDERDFFTRWERLGQHPTPAELEGLDDTQREERIAKARKDLGIKEKIGSVGFRLRFVDALQYDSYFSGITEKVQAEALQVYLLCTCFDTLAGQSKFKRFDEWVDEKDEEELIQTQWTATSVFELAAKYKETTRELYNRYLEDHGVARNFRRFFNELPEVLQNELVNSYAIVKEGEPNEDWLKMPKEKRLRRIEDYLFYRRNKYTHKSEVAPTFQPTQGIAGWVHFHIIEIEGKLYDIYITNSDEVRGETSLLVLVLVGALRNLMGYDMDDHFPKLYWSIERIKRDFRRILNELNGNSSLRLQYLGNPPVNLALSPATYRLYYFRTDAINKLLKNTQISLSWFVDEFNTDLDSEIRRDLKAYTMLLDRANGLLRQYESLSRKSRVQEKTKLVAYEKVRQALRNIDMIVLTEGLMTGFYYVLGNAPQIPEPYFRPEQVRNVR